MGLNFFSRNEIGYVLVSFAARVLRTMSVFVRPLLRSAHGRGDRSPLQAVVREPVALGYSMASSTRRPAVKGSSGTRR